VVAVDREAQGQGCWLVELELELELGSPTRISSIELKRDFLGARAIGPSGENERYLLVLQHRNSTWFKTVLSHVDFDPPRIVVFVRQRRLRAEKQYDNGKNTSAKAKH
jgi:hypothetical protein